MTLVSDYATDHRTLIEAAARAADISDPVAFSPSSYMYSLLKASIRRQLVSLDGVLIRNWITGGRLYYPGTSFGIRLFTAGSIKYARVVAETNQTSAESIYDFFVVARADYVKLIRFAVRTGRERHECSQPPVMPANHFEVLRQNTMGYLERQNLKRIRELGGRPKRGLLLIGPPGNGKTSVCRWLWNECQRLGYEYNLVNPDAYQAARHSCNPVQAVKNLFSVNRRGIIFFDDMDIALRDRETVKETDDQAVFLSALDGIEINEGAVYVFTTNCKLALIDPAFKRPGRIDLVLSFELPSADLRRALMQRWHVEVQAAIDFDSAIEQTEGYSYAEMEEIKNLFILRYLDHGEWDWNLAMKQFAENRHELQSNNRRVGFAEQISANGHN